MSRLTVFISQLPDSLPDSLRALARRFVQAFLWGDDEHADTLIELADALERSPEGAAFVRRFLSQAMEM